MGKAVIIAALALTACATPAPRIVTRDVAIPTPIACMTQAQSDAVLALLPGDMGPWLPDARQREGVYIERLSRYRSFADAVRAVLPGCIAPPVATPATQPEVK